MAPVRRRRRRQRGGTDRVQDILARSILDQSKTQGTKFQSTMAALKDNAYGTDKAKHPSRAAINRAFDRMTAEGAIKVTNPSHGVYEFEVIDKAKVAAPVAAVAATQPVQVTAEVVTTDSFQGLVEKLVERRAHALAEVEECNKEAAGLIGNLKGVITSLESMIGGESKTVAA